MWSLIKIEWLKIKKYPAFWWMLVIVALTYPSINMMFHKIYESSVARKDMAGALAKTVFGNPFEFPEAWHSVAYFSSFFVIIPAILIIMLISNEYTFKTNRQNIIDGWSKEEFILSKLLDVLIVAVIVTIAYTIIATILGLSYSSEFTKALWPNMFYYVPLFLLQTFAQLSIAFLLGFLIKRSFIALGVFLFWDLIIENIATNYIRYSATTKPIAFLANFFPFEISDKIIPPPVFFSKFNEEGYKKLITDIPYFCVYTLLLTAGIWWLCLYIYRKRDL